MIHNRCMAHNVWNELRGQEVIGDTRRTKGGKKESKMEDRRELFDGSSKGILKGALKVVGVMGPRIGLLCQNLKFLKLLFRGHRPDKPWEDSFLITSAIECCLNTTAARCSTTHVQYH
jgi:hypothetical protein